MSMISQQKVHNVSWSFRKSGLSKGFVIGMTAAGTAKINKRLTLCTHSLMKTSDSLSRRGGGAQQGPVPVTSMVLKAHLRARNQNDVFTVLPDRSFLL